MSSPTSVLRSPKCCGFLVNTEVYILLGGIFDRHLLRDVAIAPIALEQVVVCNVCGDGAELVKVEVAELSQAARIAQGARSEFQGRSKFTVCRQVLGFFHEMLFTREAIAYLSRNLFTRSMLVDVCGDQEARRHPKKPLRILRSQAQPRDLPCDRQVIANYAGN